jgi:hypothetical protein
LLENKGKMTITLPYCFLIACFLFKNTNVSAIGARLNNAEASIENSEIVDVGVGLDG